MPAITGRIFGAPPPKPRQPPSRPVAPAPLQVQSTLHRFIRAPGVAALPRITLGTDFAGMDAPALSLRALGVPFRHVFAAEILPVCRKFIWENHEVETLFYDVLARPAVFFPNLDLYVAGPPCQDYSQAGVRRGDGRRAREVHGVVH